MHQAVGCDLVFATAVKRSAVRLAATGQQHAGRVCFREIAGVKCRKQKRCDGGRQMQIRCAAHQPPPLAEPVRKKRLAVFVSGGGSNFKSILNDIELGRINGSVVVVVSDKPSCKAVAFAEELGIPTLVYPIPKTGADSKQGLTNEQLADALSTEHNVDIVLLAGYLKLIPAVVVKQYPRAMLNIHPGLLPAFGGKGMYGQRVHQAVIDSGARFSGPTVHFVDEIYDHGPILAQACVPVHPMDTAASLAKRVLSEEHSLYPKAVAALCDDRITWRHDGIPIVWEAR